jgi:hypothetical protein
VTLPRTRILTGLIALGVVLTLVLAGAARAAQRVAISARFTPERLGAPTAMSLGMAVSAPGGEIPSPLRSIDLRYPASLGIATSELGTASCQRTQLEYLGPAGCPSNSLMGTGSALARFRVGPEVFHESASIGIVAGPSQNGRLQLLISATGLSPVAARIVMSSTLRSGHLSVTVPLVPSLPEGEDVAVVAVHVTLGGNLTYRERVHGRTLLYHPAGIGLPRRCPHSGFRFSGHFTFLDASSASASTTVACPRSGRL